MYVHNGTIKSAQFSCRNGSEVASAEVGGGFLERGSEPIIHQHGRRCVVLPSNVPADKWLSCFLDLAG